MSSINIDSESKNIVLKWLSGQSFTNVLLASVLAAVGYSVPVALKQVQSGYESINKENREDRQQIRDDNIRLVNLILLDRGKPPLSEDLQKNATPSKRSQD